MRGWAFCLMLAAVWSVQPAGARGEEGDVAAPVRKHRVERNIVYSSPAGKDLHLDAYVPEGDGPFPAVLVVHGGAWMSGSKAQLAGYAHLLAERGYAAFCINYRLAPTYKFPAQIDDCRAALVWIRANAAKYEVDPHRVAGFGYSAGGHLVALLGASGLPPSEREGRPDTRLQAVIAGGAPCDFQKIPENMPTLAFWLGGTRREVPDRYRDASPLAFISKDDPPMFFFNGGRDTLVTPDTAAEMVKALKRSGVDAIQHIVADGTHISTPFNEKALLDVERFLAKQLLERKEGTVPGAE